MSTQFTGIRSFHWSTVLLTAISLSIGWGIRGNFGHEYGAMIPGCLAAVAVCLLSGREDWRERVPFFAAFGALGWGFGGSISYMQVIAYTHSGHLPSVAYGFFCLFVIGFLWAAMGGAGTAFSAVATREQLTQIVKPICWVFALWLIKKWTVWPLLERWSTDYSAVWHRQESPLYWFDADWTEALTALLAVCLYDLWDRRFAKASPLISWTLGLSAAAFGLYCYFKIPGAEFQAALNAILLGLGLLAAAITLLYPIVSFYAVAGAVVGAVLQFLLTAWGPVRNALLWLLVHPQGDAARYREAAGIHDLSIGQIEQNFLINWPQFFEDIPQHLGWVFGAIVALVIYFRRHGKFRNGSSLLLYMSVGWVLSFILLPTLLNFGGAGFRMTPPRSDDWAGILGVFFGASIWFLRNGMAPVAFASWVSGILGGVGFSGAAWLKLMLVALGNPNIKGIAPETIEAWSHWQNSNWHSFLEQSYGFINGLAIAVAMGMLAYRKGHTQGDPEQRRWTEPLAVGFVLFLLLYLNIYKNVRVWVESECVPAMMQAPLIDSITWSAEAWFNLIWIALSAAGLGLLFLHLRRPIALIPEQWLGKGQLLYLVFLWAIVVANFTRAIPGFTAGRLLTEGAIFLNAIIATLMLLASPREGVRVPAQGLINYDRALMRTIVAGMLTVLLSVSVFTATVHYVYGGEFAGHAGEQRRFGPDALWRTKPILKGGEHS